MFIEILFRVLSENWITSHKIEILFVRFWKMFDSNFA